LFLGEKARLVDDEDNSFNLYRSNELAGSLPDALSRSDGPVTAIKEFRTREDSSLDAEWVRVNTHSEVDHSWIRLELQELLRALAQILGGVMAYLEGLPNLLKAPCRWKSCEVKDFFCLIRVHWSR
jgi:hypothetical protein